MFPTAGVQPVAQPCQRHPDDPTVILCAFALDQFLVDQLIDQSGETADGEHHVFGQFSHGAGGAGAEDQEEAEFLAGQRQVVLVDALMLKHESTAQGVELRHQLSRFSIQF
jgi:hypothetical protein